MRHGQSRANAREMIISHPKNGVLDEFGLTELGKEQARRSAEQSELSPETIIYSSDFSRAQQTAEIVREIIGAEPVQLCEALRERHFGNWERTAHTHYHNVWQYDEVNADHTHDEVESVNAVLSRATQLIVELEKRYQGATILLVAHGDTLQILQCGFKKVSPTRHRSLPHLETAEIRPMQLQ